MTQIKQLIRKPIKTFLGILLVLLATAMLCVSMTQYLSFKWTRDSIETQYATIALPTNKYKISTEKGEDGHAAVSYSTSQPQEIKKLLSQLPEILPEAIHSIEYHGLITAYCNAMDPLNWAEYYNESAYTGKNDGTTSISKYPYTCAMIVFTATEISAPYYYGLFDGIMNALSDIPESSIPGQGMAVDITGTVEKAYLLHEGFDDPIGYTIRLTVRCEAEDMLSKLELREGERYLAYGMDYTDWNWSMRQTVGGLGAGAYEHCSWDNIRMLTPEEIDSLPVNNSNEMQREGRSDKLIALYSDPESGKGLYLSQTDLDQIESCSMEVVCSPSLLAISFNGEIKVYDANIGSFHTVTKDDYNSMYARPGITRLDGSLEEFLESEENTIWRKTADVIEINNHAFPVIATDNLMSIAPFGLQEAFISDGNAFTKNEYENRSNVCLISETLAVHSGLNVGDSIPVRFYETDESMPGAFPSIKTANPEAAFFSDHKGFSSEEIEFKIVGLYRQKQEWSDGPYAFTPNTIFVPKASVVGQTTTNDSGIFYSLLLTNGAQEKVEAYLVENGYEGLLAYYDQGYSDISDNLSKFFSTSVKILLVGIVGWIVFLLVFLFMFPAQQKTESERLWTLGAPKSFVVRNYIVSGIGIALPGTVLGGVLSIILIHIVLQRFTEQVSITFEATRSPLLVVGLLVFQFMIILGLDSLIAMSTTHRLYR